MTEFIQFFPPALQDIVRGIFESIGQVWSAVWWFALPLISFFIFWEFWGMYVRFLFIVKIPWTLLEIRVPKEVLKTPKAMEQIFAAAHAPYSYGLRFLEKYWEGKVEYWMSFEIMGTAGETHFYIRTPKNFRNLMEAAFYSQYPGAEIVEVQDDYVRQMPRVLPDKTYDLYGAELVLKNPDPYPIRTYPSFEESVEEQRVDPMGAVTELMSKLKSDEQIWIQVLTRPTGDEWKKKGEALINKIAGRQEDKKGAGAFETLIESIRETFEEFFESWVEAIREMFSGPSTQPQARRQEKQDQFSNRMLLLTPLEKDIVEGITEKIGKLGFETTVRFLYIDRRDAFSRDNVAGVMGAFRQFNTQHLNAFRPDKKTMTAAVHGLFKRMRLNWRKRLVFERYRDLVFNPKKSILNIEELATIYHIPITGVTAPTLHRVESRKGGPPPTLPLAE